ncbi:orotidine 5'-phosphate decarboxylase [Klebsiella pneumoniae]|nr:orotidine 5'-phosphate decarboxylase / HUMPS family protein [Klebsiella pneumoniae]MCU6623392.1 orotidine 5'-phosphate decarboxylase [Klebsiella pneumoniae]
MKLQLALDELPLDEALALTEKLRQYVDIIEIGTPFVIAEGMNAVRIFRKRRSFQMRKLWMVAISKVNSLLMLEQIMLPRLASRTY